MPARPEGTRELADERLESADVRDVQRGQEQDPHGERHPRASSPITGAYNLEATPRLGVLAPFATWFLSSMLVVVVAAFLRVAFWFVDETQGLVRRQQRTEEEEAAVRRATRVRLEREEDHPPTAPH